MMSGEGIKEDIFAWREPAQTMCQYIFATDSGFAYLGRGPGLL